MSVASVIIITFILAVIVVAVGTALGNLANKEIDDESV